MAAQETITSKVASGNGIARMSAVLTSTRSATPSRSALSIVASGRLPVRSSACHRSIPVAVPVVRRFAAPISMRPRPHPMSRTRSAPLHEMLSRSRSRSRTLPILLSQTIQMAISVQVTAGQTAIQPRAMRTLPKAMKPDHQPRLAEPHSAKPRTAASTRLRMTPGASRP